MTPITHLTTFMKKHPLSLTICLIVILLVILGGVFFFTEPNITDKHSFAQDNITDTQELTTSSKSTPIFAKRYIFTNDIKNMADMDFSFLFKNPSELSEYSLKLIRFAFLEPLQVLDEQTLLQFTDPLPLLSNNKELKTLGSSDIPKQPGIYRCVLAITNHSGQELLEEVLLIYDTTGARISDTQDKTMYVPKEQLQFEPTIDKSEYTVIDNVDGKILEEDIHYSLELRNEETHEWIIHLSYIDRAGNESNAEFLITLKEETAPSKQSDISSEPIDENNNPTNNADSFETPMKLPLTEDSAPGDVNKDGFVDEEEVTTHLTPSEQAVIDAGYGIVVLLPTGNYGVLTHADRLVNGQNGGEYLIQYLADLGLYANQIGGCWIQSEHDLYWYTASDIHPIDTNTNDW